MGSQKSMGSIEPIEPMLTLPLLQNATCDYNAKRDGQTLVIFGLFSFRKKYFLTKKAKNEDHIDKSGTHKKYYTSMCGMRSVKFFWGISRVWNNGAQDTKLISEIKSLIGQI